MLTGAALLYKAYLHMPAEALASSGGALLGGTLMGVPTAVVVFSSLIMVSRMGMWTFDMIDTQLFQMVNPPTTDQAARCTPIPPDCWCTSASWHAVTRNRLVLQWG